LQPNAARITVPISSRPAVAIDSEPTIDCHDQAEQDFETRSTGSSTFGVHRR
jgi:hypothetical protein